MKDFEKKFHHLNELMGGIVQRDEPLSAHTTFRIGGPAAMYVRATTNEELVRAVTYAKKIKIPFFILSGGSNILFGDAGLDALVIHIATSDLLMKDDRYIVVDAGVDLADVVNRACTEGLSGIAWAAGIPGDVGGAVRGNAGAYGGEMKDHVVAVEILRGKKQFVLTREQLTFGYRDSQFKHSSDIILTVQLELQPGGDPAQLRADADAIIAERATKHPHEPSAGSFFKNIIITYENRAIFEKIPDLPEKFWEYGKVPAGFLLDKVAVRGMKIGGAQIYEKHANMIINTGDATADDVLQLASLMKTKVRDMFGIQLEEEVQIVL